MVDPLFQFHRLNEGGIAKAKKIAEDFDELLQRLAKNCAAGREWSIVRTKLEEASFFAKKAMANDPQNQLDEPKQAA